MRIAHHPPCVQDCPDRNSECHAHCEKYAEWKRQMNADAAEVRKKKIVDQGVGELTRQRKEWLRHKGYKNTGGAR